MQAEGENISFSVYNKINLIDSVIPNERQSPNVQLQSAPLCFFFRMISKKLLLPASC